ncbi:MAG: hypothetical protein ACJA1L_003122 [Paracoccaceae bacterium]
MCATAETVAAPHPALDMVLSGPWPAYDFAATTLEEAAS